MVYRTHTCGKLTLEFLGETVILSGWVDSLRNMGGLVFINLRDRYGVTQITLDPQVVGQDLVDEVEGFHSEDVLRVTGTVIARPDAMKNSDMKTGEIEIQASKIERLSKSKTLPFAIAHDPKTSEENRFKHRYLDLRREEVKENVVFRAKMNQFVRQRFTNEDFLEVQTPIFTTSSPEGARDYLIPSRVNPGQFYALPQAPQQYKQLLMVGGIDKYFQIAPCFRDEDPRADRHSCEFYQIDVEMSFVTQEDIYQVVESFTRDLVEEMVPKKSITIDFVRMSYHDALEIYGSDKPDLRFDLKMIESTEIFQHNELDFLREAESIKSLVLKEQISRKQIDILTKAVKESGLGGLAYIQLKEDGSISGSLGNKLSDQEIQDILSATDARAGDTVFLLVGDKKTVLPSGAVLRNACRDMFELVDNKDLGFVWIEDFPFFEEDESKPNGLEFGHNPFSYIQGGHDTVDNLPPLERQTTQYDLTCNGYEVMSGSIRNHDPEILVKVFEAAGYDVDYIKEKFGTMYEAFQYGTPPHGGFAFGFDRLMMIFRDQDNIREMYAFPKSGRAQDLMMGAPGTIDEQDLKEIGIALKVKTKDAD